MEQFNHLNHLKMQGDGLENKLLDDTIDSYLSREDNQTHQNMPRNSFQGQGAAL